MRTRAQPSFGAEAACRTIFLLVCFLSTVIADSCSSSFDCNPCSDCINNQCQSCGFAFACNAASSVFCPDLSCADYSAGVDANFSTCFRYEGYSICCFQGECSSFGEGYPCSVVDSCGSNTKAVHERCGAGCVDATKCAPGRALPTSACRKNDRAESNNCPGPLCSSRVWGALNSTCYAYADASVGYCNSTGGCRTDLGDCAVVASRGAALAQCADNRCFVASNCTQGALASVVSSTSVCLSNWSSGSCPVGQGCGPGSTCQQRKTNGNACSTGAECQSGLCSTSGHCCSSACNSPCQTCSSGTCSNLADGANAACPSVDCTNFVATWSGLTCATYSGILGGLCSSGSCNTSPTRCVGQPLSTSGRPSCGSGPCMSSCPQYALASNYNNVAAVCFQNGTRACTPGQFCDTTGTCTATFLSNGQPCIDNSQCQSNFCSLSGHCCNIACRTECTTCASGFCASVPDGPFAPCPSTYCNSYVSGWDGNVCARYTGVIPGSCSSGFCVAPSFQLCSSTTTLDRPSCGSASCRSSCPVGATVDSFNSTAAVCLTSGQSCGTDLVCSAAGTCASSLKVSGQSCALDNECQSRICSRSGHCCSTACTSACQTCSTGTCENLADGVNEACGPLNCSQVVAGWNAETCAVYSGTVNGSCVSGSCDLSPSKCAQQAISVTGRPTCGSAGCQRNSSCPQFSSASLSASVSSVCFQSGRNRCPQGQTCNVNASCTLAASCGPPPNPIQLFFCDQTKNAWVLNCSSVSQACIVNGSIIITGNSVIVIDRPTTVRGSVIGSGNSTIRIALLPGGTTNLTIDSCLNLPNPIEISLTSSSSYTNATLLEYLDCGGDMKPPVFSPGTSWNDCQTTFTRRFETTRVGNRVAIALLFIPVEPSTCSNPTSGVLETGFPAGGAAGIAVGIVLMLIAIGAAVFFYRMRRQSRSEREQQAQELFKPEEN